MGEPIPLNAWRGRIQQGSKGAKKTLHNLMLYLRNLPGLGQSIRLNQLTGTVEWRGQPITETDYVDIQIIVEQAEFQPAKSDIPIAVERLAIDNAYHPVRDYLNDLKWDGTARLRRFLPYLFGTPDTAYEHAVGARWMIGAVARVYEPGCKMDSMLVLAGPQGVGKSTALRTLFGAAFFTEMVNELRDHKRFVEQIQGKWIVEFAELSAIRGADIEMVKAIVTMQVDKTRLSYARNTVELPRQCVLAASVNPTAGVGFLKDATGNRRFWPVKCTAIDVAKLARKRDQLWAEAVELYRSGEPWWMTPDEAGLAADQQAEHQVEDPWQDTIDQGLDRYSRYTSTAVMTQILKLDNARQDQIAKNRVAAIMVRLGWKETFPKDENRKTYRCWTCPR